MRNPLYSKLKCYQENLPPVIFSLSNLDNLLKELDNNIIKLQEQIETEKASFLSKQISLEDLIKKKSQKEEDIRIAKENCTLLASKYENELTQVKENEEDLQEKIKNVDKEITNSRVVSHF